MCFQFHYGIVSVAAWTLCLGADIATGDDVVTLTSPTNRRARLRVTGEVIEYTGRQLVVRLPDGRELKRPGKQVIEIETEWPPGKDEADRLFDAQQFEPARDKYLAAVRKETRAWARRAIIARIISCNRELSRFEEAGKLFLAIVKDDPDSPFFAEIPLAWFNAQLSTALEKTAAAWLDDEDPLAQLLGASHLLATNDRERALDRLTKLALEKDDRIARLAEAQAWRAMIPTADEAKLAGWERRVETFPDLLRAGPYWVLGRALAQHGQAGRAAIAFLHVPILYPKFRMLAADSLNTAAQLLDKQGDQAAAVRLRRELAARYPTSNAAVELRSQIGATEQTADDWLAAADDDTIEQAFLNGLRKRRLFSLAENYCRQRQSETGLPETNRVDLAVELSRTLAEHALNEKQPERDPLWTEAVEALRQTTGDPIKGPRRLLLDAQQAIVHLVHGELARQEAELAGGDEASYDAARQELRTAVGLLQETSKAVTAELRKMSQSRRPDKNELTENEQASLARNLEFQLARAFRNQGQSYPPKSADRSNSLRQAVERLQSLTIADDDDASVWPARLDQVVCLRLLDDFVAATAKLKQFGQQSPPPNIAAGLDAEQVRLLLDRNQLDAALAVVVKLRGSGAPITADLDYAFLETYVAAWRKASQAGQSSDANIWQERAAELIGEIDQRFGPYWSRRAEMLLAGSVTRGGGTQNLGLLVRAAESLYRSGQLGQALEAYDRAATQAAESKPGEAFDYAYTAAAIEQRRGQNVEAAQRFRELALHDSKNSKAGDAHLFAIYNTALAAKQGAAEVLSRDYLNLLEEHLDRWPRSPTADQVRIWLGEYYEREKQWSEAVEAYQAVQIDGPQAKAAVEGVARSYQRWLAARAASGQPTSDVAARGAAYLEKIVVTSRGALPERWSHVQRIAATGAASLWLQYGNQEFDRAERLLSAALADATDAPGDWKATAQTLQVFAVAAQGDRDKAAELLDELAGGQPAQMLVLIEGLSRVAATAPPAVARELAELQLRAAGLIDARLKELPLEEQRDFQRASIRALALAKRHAEAVTAARKLAEAFPRDGQIQEEYAQLLLDSPDRASWQAALSKWRDIGQKTRQGSERWLRAMYGQSLALVRLGEKQQAERLIKFTEAISPDLGGAELKARFRELVR